MNASPDDGLGNSCGLCSFMGSYEAAVDRTAVCRAKRDPDVGPREESCGAGASRPLAATHVAIASAPEISSHPESGSGPWLALWPADDHN